MGSTAQAQQLWHTGLLLRSMWDLPKPGLEPMSPALAGGFLTTVPPGKSQLLGLPVGTQTGEGVGGELE